MSSARKIRQRQRCTVVSQSARSSAKPALQAATFCYEAGSKHREESAGRPAWATSETHERILQAKRWLEEGIIFCDSDMLMEAKPQDTIPAQQTILVFVLEHSPLHALAFWFFLRFCEHTLTFRCTPSGARCASGADTRFGAQP